MAEVFWQIPLRNYTDVCQMLWEARQCEVGGDRSGADELKERIRLLPGFPVYYDPAHDTIVVVPKGARITVQPHSGLLPQNGFQLPPNRKLPGLP